MDFSQSPGGILNDKARIALGIKQMMDKEEFYPYYKEFPHAETMQGFLETLIPHWTTPNIKNHKIIALLMSFITLALFFLFLHTLSPVKNWKSFAFLMMGFNYWYIFYFRFLATSSHVLLLQIVSLLFFLKYLKERNLKWVTGLALINTIGFFYYTPMRVVLLLEFTFLLLFFKKLQLNFRHLALGVSLTLGGIFGVLLLTQMPMEIFWNRGLGNVQMVEPNYLTNIFYSFLMSFIAPPIQFSYYSSQFMGDPLSDAFFASIDLFPLGILYVVLMGTGLYYHVKSVKKRNEKILDQTSQVFLLFYAIGFTLIIGTAGPSYSRMFGIKLNSLKKPLWLVLFGFLLLTIPIGHLYQIKKWPENQLMGFILNRNLFNTLEHLHQFERDSKVNKFVICPHAKLLCDYYAESIPRLTSVVSIPNIESLIRDNQKQNEESLVYWPVFEKHPTYYLENQLPFTVNIKDYQLATLFPHYHFTRIHKSQGGHFNIIKVSPKL